MVRLERRPGPKSRTKPKTKAKTPSKYGLGDTDTASADDESADETQVSPAEQEQSFRTPAQNENDTDYGLEFTSSHIRTPSPRRCSTLQKRPTRTTALDTTPTRAKVVRLAANTSQTASSRKTTAPASPGKPTSSKEQQKAKVNAGNKSPVKNNRRKQLRPEQREKRFQRVVHNLQCETKFLVPRLPFSRLIRELIIQNASEQMRITITALEALQTAAEMYVTQCLQDAYLLTLHRGRLTLELRDIQLISFLRAAGEGGNGL